MKKPPTIASATPRAAHHGSSFWPPQDRDSQLGRRGGVGGRVDRGARAVRQPDAGTGENAAPGGSRIAGSATAMAEASRREAGST